MHRQSERGEEERRRDDIFIGWQSARASQLGTDERDMALLASHDLWRRQIWRWKIGGAFSPSTGWFRFG